MFINQRNYLFRENLADETKYKNIKSHRYVYNNIRCYSCRIKITPILKN